MRNSNMVKWLFLLVFIPLWLIAEIPVIFNYDDGTYNKKNTQIGWEETAFLLPNGPAEILEIQIYFTGNIADKDTVYIVGDPSDGLIPPVLWALPYNKIHEPLIINYDGVPGWKSFPVSGLRVEGGIRIGFQHKIKNNGPYIGIDASLNVAQGSKSFILDPYTVGGYGFPGIPYGVSGDYMIRLLLTYDYPDGSGESLPSNDTGFVDITELVGLLNDTGSIVSDYNTSVADWNNDGFDDLSIGTNFFLNNGDGSFTNVDSQLKIQDAYAVCWGDYDNDGDVDAYIATKGKWDFWHLMQRNENTIYQNDGTGNFTKLDPMQVFLPPYPNPSVDYELTNYVAQDSFHNPYNTYSPLWLDVNNDGYIDLYLGNGSDGVVGFGGSFFQPDQLWLNNQNGTFSRITEQSNIMNLQKKNPSDGTTYDNDLYFRTIDVTACDYNMDHQTDIHAVHYFQERDHFFKNKGDGTFDEVGSSIGVSGHSENSLEPANSYNHGQSVEWADYNHDGYPDCIVGNLAHPDWRGSLSAPTMVYKNSGPPFYQMEEVQSEIGILYYELIAGVLWGDFNNDGNLDIWHGQSQGRQAHLYYNLGAPEYKFRDMNWRLNINMPDSWSGAKLDFDNDGDIDLVINGRLYRNDIKDKGNYIELRLTGSPEDSVSSQCIGTKIHLYAGGKLFYRDLLGAKSGYRLSQSSSIFHFGLGTVNKIDSMIIFYGNGTKKTLCDLLVNNIYTIGYDHEEIPCVPEEKPIEEMALAVYPNVIEQGEKILILYDIPKDAIYQLEVVNILGQIESVLFEEYSTKGNYMIDVNAFNYSPGIKYMILSEVNGEQKQIKKIIVN